jgi:sucrose-6-phosphate hydrolase SacC (GH32 family)
MTRPRFHLTPERGFLNDPTALLRHEDLWHVYYQLSPGMVHGRVGWGHAVSDDLVTWTHRPLALAADDTEDVWTGSAVVDTTGTAGFGRDALVAAYTSFEPATRLQQQALASSADGGATWDKHGVVLDTRPAEVRDPRLFRHDGRWLMVLARAAEGRIAIHSSDDLRHWVPESEVELGAGAWPWECPDLFPLEDRWVLLVSADGATHYLLGDFDGHTFTPDGVPLRLLDHGPDLYAAVTFTGSPDRVVLGWLGNWDYAQVVPTAPWRGQMSAARRLSLDRLGDGGRYLRQRPLAPATSVTVGGRVELGGGVFASYDGAEVLLERLDPRVSGFAGRWSLPSPDGVVDVVTDTCSVEVFTGEGLSASFVTLP